LKLRITLRTETPVAVSVSPGSGGQAVAAGYIPGSTFRGALAQNYLDKNGQADETFNRLFNSGLVSYPNLYPVGGTGAAVSVLPFTARSCKRFQGFGPGPEEHGVIDMLMAYAVFNIAGNARLIDALEICRHESCGQSMARCEKEFYWNAAKEGKSDNHRVYKMAHVGRRILARVGLDGYTGTSSEGMLYSQEVLNEGQLFTGEIVVAGDMVKPLMAITAPGTEIFVGLAKSRGLGQVKIISVDEDSTINQGISSVPKRLDQFNQILKGYVDLDGARYFTLDLQSDAIIQDIFMRYLGHIPVPEIARWLKLPQDSLQQVWLNAETTPVRGWHSAQRIFKPAEIAIKSGSVFLFKFTGDSAVLDDALTRLEERGIGTRRDEGYGRITVCNPFHWEVPFS